MIGPPGKKELPPVTADVSGVVLTCVEMETPPPGCTEVMIEPVVGLDPAPDPDADEVERETPPPGLMEVSTELEAEVGDVSAARVMGRRARRVRMECIVDGILVGF